MIWPWFERLDAIEPYTKGKYAIPFNEQLKHLVRIKLILYFLRFTYCKFKFSCFYL
jgi:hypothetical protein